ncbi:UDPglucose 6-dehydrogenase [Microcella putealis]|uniref:UDP-glucose 6-dehydrogenase n=1 Tax=Microcella putealis TaxID=337005 RepID=A0A4Q7LUB1_9MICO|nr:UDP-glucose/GDP-mannose dehydrogenase family protein [Microcella putealis]RZS57389.1 UDPglucose 6-dehydrogenase [Microcella putealis]TQM19468.1 UDPglucose 6-dehydrogenase [Microcella putealis]
MKISVIGCGYLGAVHAAGMAELGHTVVGVDIDAQKIAALTSGRAPFFEPGVDGLLQSRSDRLRFTTDISEVADAEVHFIAVGTPQAEGGAAADMRFVDAAFASLVPHLRPGALVVGKSTVPVGTAAAIAPQVEAAGASLAWNPEFLREGFAVADTLTPDRLVYGVRAGDDASVALLDRVYSTTLASGTPRIVTDFATAELVKVSANAFLATKISFINAMAEIAEVTGADVTTLADAIGHDTRIGRRFLNAGVGFGGGCLPKDIRAFQARADELGVGHALEFLDHVDQINQRRRARVVELALAALDDQGSRDATVAVLGLAFKPNSDDVRDSPAVDVAVALAREGVRVVATDPQAQRSAARKAPAVTIAPTVEEAINAASVVLVLTEWPEYRDLDPAALAPLTPARVVIDGRNCLDADKWRAAGWTYRGLGRS